ncbi:MAG: DNA-directed RNA polymerase subunit K [Crenarchaeota archaeon]|nr:DNA-directed RNA polymerase subunit K [Thermoproteota archaeon]MCR8454251.1 DNA-directed RNA polymerase subunit K [Thermoproteota archaeon]MCR8454763.1 DNA-directed RNA polymerase subunit K [Thermoproteota archaeon]MCR8462655.1 DNA-directed RNA polymerase subunit K [Thermoproteota archaeon]MCR8470274.1 DNA-directed RNA polymerase subunit K [Thermoproteota archaeon]
MALKKRISDNHVVIGPPHLTRYEYATLVAIRAIQIAYGAPAFLSKDELKMIDSSNPIQIAKMEISKKKVPLTICRYLPTGEYQLIPLAWLEVLDE